MEFLVAVSKSILARGFLVVFCLAAYIIGFVLFHQATSGAIAATVVLPVVVLAWFGGWRVGLLAGLLSIVLNMLLYGILRPEWADITTPLRNPSTLVAVTLGVGIGWMRQLLTQLREQATALAGERETLQIEVRERQHAHEALHESEARFRGAFDSAAIGMALVALDGRWLQVNPAICAIVGYAEAELLATTNQAITHPEDLHADLAFVQQILAGGIPTYQMEKRYIHKSGHLVWVLLSVSLVRDTHDQPWYFVSQIQDITPRKQAEAELAQSYARNYALLDALPDTMYRIGLDGTLHDYKAGHVLDLAAPAALFFGSHVSAIFPHALAQQIEDATREVAARGTLRVIEHQAIVGGAVRDYEIRVVGGMSDEVLALVRDITERKTVERMKDEFVAMVSHELRTPLTAIHGAMRLLAGGVAGALPPKAHAMAEIAVGNSDRLIRLINDLLDIQKIESGMLTIARKPLALRPLLEQTLRSNQDYGRQYGVTFALDYPPQEIMIYADGDRVMQVLTNLLANAAKFSPAGESVLVRVTAGPQAIRIAVIDHGPGIPASFQPQVFEKFTQANTSSTRQSGGSGLGLSIAKAIVERLGGTIGFESSAGAGTTFYVDLPISTWAAEPGTLAEHREDDRQPHDLPVC